MQEDDNDKQDLDFNFGNDDPGNEELSIDGPSTAADLPNANDESDNKKSGESTISSDLIRGHINTIILRALYERDKYGYEIINDIEQKSHGQYTLKQPTLYSALKRLETQGYIKAYWMTDKVTLGGRRKYFTLTESGKEITEKNLSEWEYSRTIIDSLISDKSFDFNNPAPKPVDFTILRDSVSRVPIVKNEEVKEQQPTAIRLQTQPLRQTEAQQTPVQQPAQSAQTAPTTPDVTAAPTQPAQAAPVITPAAPIAPTAPQQSETKQYSEEELKRLQAEENERRRIAHENYLKLVSEPIKDTERQHDEEAARAEKIETEKLLYNNKPETERDYKNLIDAIYDKTLINGSTTYYQAPPTDYSSNQQQPRPHQKAEQRQAKKNMPMVDKGRADGVTVIPSDETAVTKATKTTYNKGLTLLKSSFVVLAVILAEFILTFIFKDRLETSTIYPVVILLIGIAQFIICLAMALSGYGRHSVRPTGSGYIGASLVLCVIAILIIAVMSILLNMNASLIPDLMKKLIIPSATALNIPIFAISFKLFVG